GSRFGGNPPDHGGGLWSGGRQFHRNSPPTERMVPELDRFLPGAASVAANPAGLRTGASARKAQPAPSPVVRTAGTVVGTPRPSPFPFARRPVERKCPDGQRGHPLSDRSGRLFRGSGGGSRLFGNVRRLPRPLLRRVQRGFSPAAGVFRSKTPLPALLPAGPFESVRRSLRSGCGPNCRAIRRLISVHQFKLHVANPDRIPLLRPLFPEGLFDAHFPQDAGQAAHRIMIS